ncbi:fatty acyl-AMP ligase [Plantactinospora sp. BB1]|uniref:fatty acyl-AMP ligase n=1 Tax=Plantactinospora sp. BB1 TaxID=2071627 RepID=UPI000D16986B|nr:fatty acyl-AMP ligase [Plantactinospora sp. BB1]AVT40951.1 peptide synthetase [Plantactinospora sp. BB1]
MELAETFTGQLLRHVRDRPQHPAVVFTEDPRSPDAESRLSYGQLHAAATRLAARLRAEYQPGSRMLLLYPSGLEFVVAFVACQYAGLVAVPAPEPDRHPYRRQRLLGIMRNSTSAAVLTTDSRASEVHGWMEAVGARLPVVTTDAETEDREPTGRDLADPSPDEPRAEALSFLQYTSGSTAAPRGTMVSQRNLAEHSRMFLAMLGITGPVSIGGWLPMFHDMGLVGHVVTPLFSGGTSVLMSPTSFLRRPGAWLTLIDRYRLYMSAAPNFGYDMCVARVSDEEIRQLDLSRWTVAINGSEPVQAHTVEQFTRRFAAAGLRPETVCPGYGLAEATLAVSLEWHRNRPTVIPVEAEPLTRHVLRPLVDARPDAGGYLPRLVGSGQAAGPEVRIVDPQTREVLPERTVGEIWVRGPSVAEGYWAAPEATAETFAAVTADGESGFLRTGDLGVLHGDELYVTGRIKEVLVVFGRNLYPQDIEAEARAYHESLVGLVGAAFTIPVPHEEVVLLHEYRPGKVDGDRADEAPRRLADALQLHLSRAFGAAVSVVLVPPRTIPRTTSGKVQRHRARQLFLDGAVRPVAANLTTLARRCEVGTRYPAEPVAAAPAGGAVG